MPKQITSEKMVGDITHEWSIPEYESHDRGAWWHIIMITLSVALVLYGVFSGNFLFSLVIILAAIILFLQAHQEPMHVSFAITDTGIVVGRRLYPYNELNTFYIVYQPPQVKTLYFDTKGFATPTLRIPLIDQNPVEVRHALLEHLSENLEVEEEPLSDTAARAWKLH